MNKKDIILKAENISKQYRLGTVGTGTLSHDLNRWWHAIRGKEDPYLKVGETNDRSSKGNSDYVWALQDINFEVNRGEVLGIIGKNGAGKSTLLKILSKVTAPTTGVIKSRGRIASLLEVGTGFNPELTGRENIYLNGAILGMTKKEITSKLDEIIAFSGCERYIDTPTKRYSSGMTVRLAFAVAAFLEPEILVVDEVLAVGDAEFQKKAIGKMQDISKSEGRTVLFVSHNMAAVRSLCTRGMLIENGKTIFFGDIDETIDLYLKSSIFSFNSNNYIEFDEKEAPIQISKFEVSSLNLKGERSNSSGVLMGNILEFSIFVLANQAYNNLKASIIISTASGTRIAAIRSHEITDFIFDSKGDFVFKATASDLKLMPGDYVVTIALAENNTTIDIKEECLGFTVVPNDVYGTGRIPKGNLYVYSDAKWELNQK
ncbi:ABC transporter ATP-binding protein [Flavobacterium cheniae]|uniref:Lipopolysaccharide transport system ATP-binding protein n=1 Tax=Flavobacterium cheniae TaxID=295428 RepID=A0A562KPA3_9FLAO|nr:ABC transporter ATP-binding protein [Flavobacterium cheniae]TDR22946.1 lipopolysaccharide transport system ATP-binding protein [Flavobacterium cheniae]TWH97194.1 lipopolysaccharide transport system ATP-binding protein [Flavobacterium cheniae]